VYGYLITPTASGNLGSIGAPIGDLSGSSASVTFYVYTNNDGAPGTLLDTLTATVGTFTCAPQLFSSPIDTAMGMTPVRILA
jgi:hypothetical protein